MSKLSEWRKLVALVNDTRPQTSTDRKIKAWVGEVYVGITVQGATSELTFTQMDELCAWWNEINREEVP